MTAEQFRNEKLYLATMGIVASMRNQGLMTEEEHAIANHLMLEKYRPILSGLMAETR